MHAYNELSIEKKYELYEASVQNPTSDIQFINREYRNRYHRSPKVLREDFMGTGLLSCEWVKQNNETKAFGFDLDPEPIKFGKENHYIKLSEDQKSRVNYIMGNVLEPVEHKAHVACAFNFSYFIFKERKLLVEYFTKVREGLHTDGMFVLDLFGGLEARQPLVEETEHDDFSYFWDCEKYNPLTQECFYAIHFKDLNTQRKYENVFTYDWRLWSPKELREVLIDAGFSETKIYWEGEDEDGTGDGNFYETNFAENCESWVTYIIAFP